MTPDRWSEVRGVFLRAAGAPPEQREALVCAACSGDSTLRDEVLALLRADAADSTFDADPAGHIGLPSADALQAEGLRDVAPPDSIGGYRIDGVLGEGGFGVVYRAEQASPRRPVALKTIRPALTTSDAARRLQREARVLASLDHPGIAKVFEAGVARDLAGAGTPYFAMELVEGPNVLQHASETEMGVLDRLELFLQVCDAVAHAHHQGVIHRDLKPNNVLVGRDGRAKVLDFGVAFLLRADSATLLTQHHSGLLGTLAYMSPEHVGDDPGRPDTRSDVYSLGAMLYELLANRPMFDFTDCPIHTALRRVHDVEPPLLGRVAPELRGDLEAIAAKAVAKNRDHRYQSVPEFAEDLRRWLRQEPVLARRISVARRLRLWAGRRRGLATGVAAAIAIGVGAGAWLAVSEARLHREHQAAREALEGLLTGVVKELAPMAGTAARREQVLRWADDRVTRMLRTRPHDPRLQEMNAEVLCALADVAIEQQDGERAHELRKRALAVREAIRSKSAEAWASLSFNLALVADGTRDRGDGKAAWAMYDRALELDERLSRENPNNARMLDNLTWSYERLVGRLIFENRLDEAETIALERVEAADRLVRIDETRTISYHARWAALAGLSDLYALQNRQEEAIALYALMRADAEVLVAREPHHRRYRTNQVGTLLATSVNLRAAGRAAESVDLLERVVAMTIALAEANESDASSLENLAHALVERAMVRAALGHVEPATADARRTLEVCERLEALGGGEHARLHRFAAIGVLERLEWTTAAASSHP